MAAWSSTSASIASARPPAGDDPVAQLREAVGTPGDERDRGAVRRQHLGKMRAEPARGAGHQRDPSRDVEKLRCLHEKVLRLICPCGEGRDGIKSRVQSAERGQLVNLLRASMVLAIGLAAGMAIGGPAQARGIHPGHYAYGLLEYGEGWPAYDAGCLKWNFRIQSWYTRCGLAAYRVPPARARFVRD